ncbi:MAG: GNAT family N-acetyltransferase [Pseudoxanthomonas sp.]
MDARSFHVESIEYATGLAELRAIRETVFVHEQNVPVEEEWDALDPVCLHVIARDAAGKPIGTGRLTPEHKIGRMAVLADWRGQGVGDAMLAALTAEAHKLAWPAVSLNAQVSAEGFYARQGFIPHGPRFYEAGIEHQAMRRDLKGATAVENSAGGVAALLGVVTHARRSLRIYSRELDPGLLDHASVLDALRRFATRMRGGEVQVLLQDAAVPQRALAPLLTLAQRLPSVFAFREVREPVDRGYASAFMVNDNGGYYFRSLGNRFDGESSIDDGSRARQLAEAFKPVWERARVVTEYRALGA